MELKEYLKYKLATTEKIETRHVREWLVDYDEISNCEGYIKEFIEFKEWQDKKVKKVKKTVVENKPNLKYKVGDKMKVIDRDVSDLNIVPHYLPHDFNIGELVTIIEIDEEDTKQCYYACENKLKYACWCREQDLQPV